MTPKLEILSLGQMGMYFAINICCSWWKKNYHAFPRAYPQKKHNNIHYPKANSI